VVIFHAEQDLAKEKALSEKGATLFCLKGSADKVDLPAMVQQLGRLHYNEVHVEAGHKLNGSLLNAGLIDELLVYVAPQLVGPGQGMAALTELKNLTDAQAWQFFETSPIGSDLRLLLRHPR
jgi:diaminohydroxyphosphoribosylaminopyrimidine deaminase/5-amino-6-(5-phosphoribosylamino)uracil reductase